MSDGNLPGHALILNVEWIRIVSICFHIEYWHVLLQNVYWLKTARTSFDTQYWLTENCLDMFWYTILAGWKLPGHVLIHNIDGLKTTRTSFDTQYWLTEICQDKFWYTMMTDWDLPGRLIQSAAGIRDREVSDPDWIGNLVNPSRIRGERKQSRENNITLSLPELSHILTQANSI